MRITDPRTFNSKLVTELQLDALSGVLTTNYENFVKSSLKGSSSQTAPVSYGYAYLNADGKVDPALMPPLAINETYTVEATNDSTSSLDLIKSAVTAASVERGDVVIVYAGAGITAENAEKLCGTFIFVKEVAKGAITEDSYKKIYTPAGGVKTVNGIAAVNGNVTLAAKDIKYSGNTTIETALDNNGERLALAEGKITTITSDAETAGSMQYYAKQAETNAKSYTDGKVAALAAVKKFVKVASLDPKPSDPVEGTLYYTEAGQCAIYAESAWVDISEEIITSIADDTAGDEKLASIGAIKAYVEAKVNPINTELPKKADKVSGATDGHLASLGSDGNLKDSGYSVSADTALSGETVVPTSKTVKSYVDDKVAEAIKITSVTHTWAANEKVGQIYTWTTPGRVIQVCDASGWVFPGVQFSGEGKSLSSTITVAMENEDAAVTGETWTYFIASTLG
ncbi:MAG: hypothetical protein J6J11_09365 [Treponema sp.]|nr:hypothetical protein [Clostridia bacterium]MBP3608508.1 hypothetical protein [Treponema sp.]